MNMNYALVIDVLGIVESCDTLHSKLLNHAVEFSEAISPISKRNLREDDEGQDCDEDLSFHNEQRRQDACEHQARCLRSNQSSKSTLAIVSVIVCPNSTTFT